MWISVFCFALLPQTIDGLNHGESFHAGPPEAALGARECVRGRVIDGFTSQPVVGAEIELWAEGWQVPDGAIASGKSLADGSFRLPHPGIKFADKVLVRAKGYRNTTVATSDAQEILLLPITKNLGLRVVDLEGKPIAGARMESRQTCAHAPHAYIGESDADGRFDLSTFPPLLEYPEMIVTARGYGAVFLGSTHELLLPGGFEVRLPRRKPIAFQAVDATGKPLGHRRVSLGAEPEWIAQTTDERGRVQFDSPFFGRNVLIQIEDGRKASNLAAGWMPSSFEPRLVLAPPSTQESREPVAAEARIPVHLIDVDDAPIDARVGVLHATGSELETTFMEPNWGRTTVFVGGPFTGYDEIVRVLEQPIETTLRLTGEKRLELVVPETSFDILHVQVGDDSITLGEGPLILPVPTGGPLVICYVNDGQTLLARPERKSGETRIDLSPSNCVVQNRPRAGKPSSYRFKDADGEELSVSLLTAWGDIEPLPDDHPGKGVPSYAMDPSSAFEGRVGAEGRVTRAIGPTIASLGTGQEFKFTLPRRGSLQVHGALRALYAGGSEGELLDDRNCIVSDLAPGPLLVDIVRIDGSVISLSLVLGDGEQRDLTLH